MKLTGEQNRQLQNALLSAFPSRVSLRSLVRITLEENLEVIAGDGNLPEIVFQLIEWVEARGKLKEFLEKTSRENPGNSDLHDILVQVGVSEPEYEARIQTHLRAFLTKIEGRLENMLSLSARETPDSVKTSDRILRYITLPPSLSGKNDGQGNDSRTRTFETFPEAFEAIGKRVLLLGAPGAGKTTTLLQFACTAAAERLHSPEKPLPVFVSVHHWDPNIPLAQWTQTILLEALPDIRVNNRSLLYLFDGLDELGGERPVDTQWPTGKIYDPRPAFLKAVEEQLPAASVVISCREQDYQQIGEKATLEGAVTLLPLEPAQIERFLNSRNQSALWSAITDDTTLLELVRTPLVLAILSIAIGEQGTTEALTTGQITTGTIFDFYIKQRFAHQASKRTLPCDDRKTRSALGQIAASIRSYFKQRFTYEASKGFLPFDEQKTRRLLGQIAASMWENCWFPKTEIDISSIEKLLKRQGIEFLQLMQEMHFMRAVSSQSVQFIHLKFRDYCALPVLFEALKDKNAGVRRSAAYALGAIGDVAVLSTLLEALKYTDAGVRASAADALGRFGDVTALPALLEAFKDTDAGVRGNVAAALGRIGDVAALPALTEALKDEYEYMRWSAAGALGAIGDVAALPALLEALKDPDAGVRGRAAGALEWIKGSSVDREERE